MDNNVYEKKISFYNKDITEDDNVYKQASGTNIDFHRNNNRNYEAHSEAILPKPQIRTQSAFDSNKNIQANVYNKVINNIKKVYNMQKQVLYATELEKEKLVEDARKKNKPYKEQMKGSQYELDSTQISRVIFKQKRMLDVQRFKRLLNRRQNEKARELEDLKKEFKAVNNISESESKQEPDQDYFMTQFEQEEENPSEEILEEHESESQRESSEQVEEIEEPLRNNFFRKPQSFAPSSTLNSKTSSVQIQKNQVRTYKAKTLLRIDSRWNAVPKFGEPLNDKEHLKRVFTFDGAMKGRRKPFVPAMKTKRHPQLEKIEAYFKDCNPECIPRTPLMKIPTVFEIDKAPERMQNNLDNLNIEAIPEETNMMITQKYNQNKTVNTNNKCLFAQNNKIASQALSNKFIALKAMNLKAMNQSDMISDDFEP